MKKIFYTSLLVSVCNVGMAQYSKVQIQATPVKGAEFTSRSVDAEYIGFRNPPSDDLLWMPVLTKVSENESESSELLEKIKEQKNALKQSVAPGSESAASRTTVIADPVVGNNFVGAGGIAGSVYTPLDNTVAISNNDTIVAFVNAQVAYFTKTGTQTYNKSIYNLINDATLTNMLCDPKVIFDPVAKRFIFYCQVCDQVSSHDKIVLGFSKSSNPADGWRFYKFTGNPLGDGSWWDYPKLGISNDEVFVTGNLFYDGGSTYNQSVVMQIQKAPCYSGGTPLTKVWSSISGGGLGAPQPFTFLPLSYGQNGSYGPGIYLVTTVGATLGQSTYRLYDITNNIASGTAAMLGYDISLPTYATAGDAAQKGTSFYKLNTGDSRAQDGFYLHGNVYFVFNKDAGSGFCGICYNRLKLSTMANSSATFGGPSSGVDRAYPAIASASNDSLDKSVLIAYEESSSTIYPRMGAVGCDSNMTWSSASGIVVHSGTNYNSYDGNASQRWGDYTGLAKKYGDTTAWMAGMYANTSNQWVQWIAELKPAVVHIPHTAVATVNQQQESVKVYPNPIVDNYHVKFSVPERQNIVINITDMEGRTVVELYHSIVEEGESIFSFNKANLAPGVYSLNIIGEKTNLKNERIVITGK